MQGHLITTEAQSFGSSYLVAKSVTAGLGDGSALGMVPVIYFGPNANQLGMRGASYVIGRQVLCPQPLGAVTSPIENGNPHDQLAALRAEGLRGCAVREKYKA